MLITENLPQLDNNYHEMKIPDNKIDDVNSIAKRNLVNQSENPHKSELLENVQQTKGFSFSEILNLEEKDQAKKEKYHDNCENIKKIAFDTEFSLNDLLNLEEKDQAKKENEIIRENEYEKDKNLLKEENREIKKEKTHYYQNIKKIANTCIKHFYEIICSFLLHSCELVKFTFKCLNDVALMSFNLIREVNLIKNLYLIIEGPKTSPTPPPTTNQPVIENKIVNNYYINLYFLEIKA